jgi:uncharacterized membrane protein
VSAAIFSWVMSSLFMFMHPYHVSQTELNYNQEEKAMEVSIRINSEDLEKALQKDCKCKIELMKTSEKMVNEQAINGYLSRHLLVSIDGEPVTLSMLGYEIDSENTWSYFEVKEIPAIKKIEMNNKILYELHKEQVNLIQVKANGKVVNNKLEFPNTRFSAIF